MNHEIIWQPSPNFRPGRSGWQPLVIVSHITDGPYPGCLHWLTNPHRYPLSSAHYLINRAGRIYQLVRDEDTAWGNGVVNRPSSALVLNHPGVNPNLYSLSIEHEGTPWEPLTEAQTLATIWLHEQLCTRWEIPRSRNYLLGHHEIDSVNRANCPGAHFPWTRLLQELAASESGSLDWASYLYQGLPVRIRLDGELLPLDGRLIGDRTFVPLRALAEQLKLEVSWNEAERIVDLQQPPSA